MSSKIIAPRIGIQASPFSGEIHVGPLAANGQWFTSKEDMTSEVLGALADLVSTVHEGHLTGTLVTSNGKRVRITVQTTPEEEDE